MREIVNDDTESAVVLHQILSAAFLRKFDISEDEARQLADELASGIREEAGSQKLYIPGPNRERRNKAILEEWNGRNARKLARKYSLSLRQVERIIANGEAHV